MNQILTSKSEKLNISLISEIAQFEIKSVESNEQAIREEAEVFEGNNKSSYFLEQLGEKEIEEDITRIIREFQFVERSKILLLLENVKLYKNLLLFVFVIRALVIPITVCFLAYLFLEKTSFEYLNFVTVIIGVFISVLTITECHKLFNGISLTRFVKQIIWE